MLTMSTPEDKFKKSKRILKDNNAIQKQVKIAKLNGLDQKIIDQPHRLEKHHAMNCGNPKCHMCSNPRKVFNEKTIQEKRFEQTEGYDNE